eukprot:4950224-Ditylum_brightwellii.AAC.1
MQIYAHVSQMCTSNNNNNNNKSESFIKYANQMKHNEKIQYRLPVEGDLYEKVFAVHDDGVTTAVRNKVHFFVGDACKLPLYALPKEEEEEGSDNDNDESKKSEKGRLGGTFDGVILANLLCRLPNPLSCLDGLAKLVNKGGIAVIVTPFSWFEHFTPKQNWIGGYYDSTSNEPVLSKDRLKDCMEERGFERIHVEQMPLVIREHQRKYQYIVSEATGWRKK